MQILLADALTELLETKDLLHVEEPAGGGRIFTGELSFLSSRQGAAPFQIRDWREVLMSLQGEGRL
jgi:hypothetical protein